MVGALIIAIGVHATALGLGEVPAVGSGVSVMTGSLIFGKSGVAIGDGGAGEPSVVAGTVVDNTHLGVTSGSSVVVVMVSSSSSADGTCTCSGLSTTLAVPELAATSRARGVIVRRAGAVSLLLLVVANQRNLDQRKNEEYASTNDSASEDGLIVPASSTISDLVGDLFVVSGAKTIGSETRAIMYVARTQGSVHSTGALVSTLSGKDGDGDKATAE